jgi:diguanylate cyclase (GGDEF)-like protein
MKVLLADDSALARRLLLQMLARWGHEAVVCADGEQAWAALQEKDAPVLAILDWEMPKLSGVELCRRIRATAREPYVYVLLLTANERKEGVIEGLAAGADDYVRKPFDEQELEVRIRVGQRITDLQTELVAAREALRAQATHDSLTGLWNRGAILERLRVELARSKRENAPLAALMVDLDHFKKVNDTMGHLGGDAVLREASRRIHSVIRSYDAAGRYGGEEFLVLLPGCDREAAHLRADQLRLAICDQPINADGQEIVLTASIGVAARSRGGTGSPDELVKAADDALYRAKEGGRNRVELESTAS